MSIELVQVSKNTRGINSREIKYMAIGKWETRIVQKESKPEFNDDGTPKLDKDGNQIRTPLGKDKDGRLITQPEEVKEFVVDGVLTDIADAMSLVNDNEQELLDCFAEGFNARQYDREASKDELDEFLATLGEMNDEQKSVVKRTIRQLSKALSLSITEAAEQFKMMVDRKKAATAAA